MDDKLHKELVNNLKAGVQFAKGKNAPATVYAVPLATGGGKTRDARCRKI